MYLQPIGPEKHGISHDLHGRYLYRGYAILGCSDGWNVLLLDYEGFPCSEAGWGNSMYEAMAVVNELVDGSIRRKSK